MQKLFYRLGTGELAYHEAWVDGREITEHWGIVGTRGETRSHARDDNLTDEEAIERVLSEACAKGFEEGGEPHVLLIEYEIDGNGSQADLSKRHELEARMNETLGWTGIGHCDGGSIGSGTMEVCCLVVDFSIAKEVIEGDLRKTQFADYARIYREECGDGDGDATDTEG